MSTKNEKLLVFLKRIKFQLFPPSFQKKITFNEIDTQLLHELVKIINQCELSKNRNSMHRSRYLLKILSKLLNIYGQMRNKLKHEENNFPNIITLTSNPDQTLIEQLANTNCLRCNKFVIENFPISSVQMIEDIKPYFIVNENNFVIVDEVQSFICSLANKNGGSILIVHKHIKNLIKQGVNINKASQERLKIILSQAYNGIVGKQNIGISVEAIPLKKDNKIKQNEHVIRINVNVSKNRQLEGFYTEYKFKNFKPVYKIYDVEVKSFCDLIQMNPAQIQNDYKKMQQMYGRKHQLILCKCSQKFQSGIKINLDSVTGVPVCKQEPNFNPNSKQFILQIFDRAVDTCKKQNNFQDKQFPEIGPQQTAVIFIINEICDQKLLLQTIESVFRNTKTNYKKIHPMKEFQASVNISQKNSKPLVRVCEIVYFIFQGRYDQFKTQFEQYIKKQGIRRQQFLYEQLENRIQLTYMINQAQIQKFNDLIYQIFVTVPKWDNMEYPKGPNQNKLYKNASVSFYDKNIAAFAYLVLYCGKLRPKFEKKQKKKQDKKQKTNYKQTYVSKTINLI